jgi:hypothetical protein
MQEKITTIKKDNMKEKIEEILLHLDSYFEQAMGTEVTREDWVNLRKELSDLISTLIQEEREEAVRGFAEYVEDVKNKGRVSSWVEEYFYLKENKE